MVESITQFDETGFETSVRLEVRESSGCNWGNYSVQPKTKTYLGLVPMENGDHDGGEYRVGSRTEKTEQYL